MTDVQTRPFVLKLDEWRRQLGMGHTAFATQRLGITRQMWHDLRSGKKRVSLRLAGRVLRERPEWGYFLAAEATGRASTGAAA
jgi:hypothetical protein